MKMTFNPLMVEHDVGAGAAPMPIWPLRWLQPLGRRIVRAYAVHRQRQGLLQLDARMLKDIGISRADAWREGHLPFWVDSHWRPGE